ncbi:MAG TPA: DivIVA domain-containing protein [Jatrophihabitantaceae bacterium]|nr:DivIVA domain-containing protein [Jatrophihabitantaceae bacterium]
MLTLFLYALLAIIVVAGLFALAVYVLPKGEQIAPPAPDTRPWESLPDHQLRPEDVVSARLPVALRGYRFAETDLLLDRLTDELRERDDEIARLRGARTSIDGLPSARPDDAYRPPQQEDDAYRPPQQEDGFGEPRLTEASSGDQPAHD